MSKLHKTITAIPQTKPLPSQSQADALYLQGCRYFVGKDVEQSYDNAVRCFTEAAEQNHPLAQYCLGCMHLDGIGIERIVLRVQSGLGNPQRLDA